MKSRKSLSILGLGLLLGGLSLAILPAPEARASGTIEGPRGTASQSASQSANPSPPTGPVVPMQKLANVGQFTAAEKSSVTLATEGNLAGACPGTSGGASKAGPCIRLPGEQPQAFGSSTAPYSTMRVAVEAARSASTALELPVTSYPFRAAGKLYFKIGTANYVCSASLLRKGVLITAAHCVFDFGVNSQTGFFNSFQFCPANTTASGGVYGCYTAFAPRIASSYYNGSDTCSLRAVVCNNDVATLLVSPKTNIYAGQVVGTYSYGWNGYSFTTTTLLGGSKSVAQAHQLGYPQGLDSGLQMQRTDAPAWYFQGTGTNGQVLKNTQMGSAQTRGSSGGPLLVNLGMTPTVTNAGTTNLGSATVRNVVVGVTSYGSTQVGFNRQGWSWFGQNVEFPNAEYGGYGAGNIGKLMQDTCTANPSYC